MSEQKDSYNLNQLWRLFSKERDARLVLTSFNQGTTLVVFSDKSQDKRPIVNIYLDITANMKLVHLLKKLVSSTPNTRLSFVQLRWNKENKSNDIVGTLVFGKNDDNTMYVEASSPQHQQPSMFEFTPITNVELEGRASSPAENSEYAVRSLIKVLEEYVPTAELLSTWNYKPMAKQQSGSNRGGGYQKSGGGYQRGGGNSNYRNNDGNDRDDLF